MLSAYFDTNVYDHIDKGYVNAAQIETLRKARAGGEFIVHLSIADVEELLGQWETDRSSARQKLKIARDIAGFDEILKQPSDLLADAYRAYADDVSVKSSSMPHEQRDVIISSLHRIVAGDTQLDPIMSQSLKMVREIKENFCEGMVQFCATVRAEWAKIDPAERRKATFEGYWRAGATGFALDLAPPDCVNACREHGVDGLLQVRAVRLFIGALMSLIFSQVAGDSNQTRQPQRGDFYDLWHTITASVADIFLTYDTRFAGLLKRVPISGWRTVTTLSALLAEVRCV